MNKWNITNESYIENELKRNKIPKKTYNTTKDLTNHVRRLSIRIFNRGPRPYKLVNWQATAVPVSQLAIRWQGCKALI